MPRARKRADIRGMCPIRQLANSDPPKRCTNCRRKFYQGDAMSLWANDPTMAPGDDGTAALCRECEMEARR